jgi:plasmid stabilization system protein ParE
VTPSLRIHSLASLELTEAVRWYESKRPGLGGELLDEFSASIARLVLNPESGNPMSLDQRTRRLLVTRFPYQIVYRVCPSEIVIVALAHLKRRPGYWTHRDQSERPRPSDPSL